MNDKKCDCVNVAIRKVLDHLSALQPDELEELMQEYFYSDNNRKNEIVKEVYE